MYRLTDDQRQLLARLERVADEAIAPHADRVDRERAFPRESIAALGDAGFLGLTIAPQHGGPGQGLRVMAAALEGVAGRCASTAMVYLMHLCGVAVYAAAPEKTAPLLKAAAAGRHLSTLAFSDRGSRSQFWTPSSRAAPANGSVRLTAHKTFVTSAGHADGYVVSMLDANASKPTDSTLYLVLRDDGGLRVAGTWEGLGMRGNASAPMVLDDVRVGSDRALTAPGKGLDVMLGVVLPAFQVGTA